MKQTRFIALQPQSALKRLLTQWSFPFLRGKGENKIGYLQKDEALFLYALVKVVRPKTVVEFGFLEGYSAYVILSALDIESRLYSYDNSAYAAEAAIAFTRKYPNFFFHQKDQQAFDYAELDGKKIDLVLFDASHDLAVNQQTFEKLLPFLSDEATLLVHDTGVWKRNCMKPEHLAFLASNKHTWLDDETVAHQAGERKFVNWIVESHPDFGCLHFGSEAVLRNGFTLVGRKRTLLI